MLWQSVIFAELCLHQSRVDLIRDHQTPPGFASIVRLNFVHSFADQEDVFELSIALNFSCEGPNLIKA